MKISKEKAAENRQALIQAASRLFKEKGIDGVGVAEISKAAGLTHGALYAHFSSKDELAAEAMGYNAQKARERLYDSARSLAGGHIGVHHLLQRARQPQRRVRHGRRRQRSRAPG